MTTDKLGNIFSLDSCANISRALAHEGFFNCKRVGKFKEVSLYDIAKAPYVRAKTSADSRGREYVGDIIHDVKSFEHHEFIIVQMLAPVRRGSDIISTKRMTIFSKKS